MAEHDRDPVLRELIQSVDEAGRPAVPVTLAVNGTVLHGSLIGEERYFAGLAEVNSLMNGAEPAGWAARQRLREKRESARLLSSQ